MEKALSIDDWLYHTFPEQATKLEQKLQLTPEVRLHWQEIIAKIWIPYDQSTALIEKFEGFFQLEDIDLAKYEPRDRSIQAILGIEATNKRQVLKQPDVLMLHELVQLILSYPA